MLLLFASWTLYHEAPQSLLIVFIMHKYLLRGLTLHVLHTCRSLRGRMVVALSSCCVPTTVFMYRTWQLTLWTRMEKKFGLLMFSVLWQKTQSKKKTNDYSACFCDFTPARSVKCNPVWRGDDIVSALTGSLTEHETTVRSSSCHHSALNEQLLNTAVSLGKHVMY